MSSLNNPAIKTLVNAISNGLSTGQSYDLLRRISEDLDEAYTALFTGPLPAVSGENLDLSNVPPDRFPDNVAYIDVANVFTEDQTLRGLLKQIILHYWDETTETEGVQEGRFLQITDGEILVSNNLSFDSPDWVYDDNNFEAAGLRILGGRVSLVQFIADVFTEPIIVDEDKIISIGNPAVTTGADEDEIVISHMKSIRAVNFDEDNTLGFVRIDDADIFQMGIDADPDGTGHVAIPTVVDTDLPAAAAGQNGTIVIDDTNDFFVYYSNGSRFQVAGVSF